MLFIITVNSINAAQPQSRPLSGNLALSAEIKIPRKNGCRNRPTESSIPEQKIMQRSLRDKTFIALFHSLGFFPASLHSFKSLIHCDCNCSVSRGVLSSSCNGQKSDCCRGRWLPVLNKLFVHQKKRKEIKLAFLCGCVGTSYSCSSFILPKKEREAIKLRKKAVTKYYRVSTLISTHSDVFVRNWIVLH